MSAYTTQSTANGVTTNTIVVPPAARFGRNVNGANDARDAWWNQEGNNDAQQGAIRGGMDYANGQSALGQSRGPTATEDPTLAANEASGAGGNQAAAIGLAGTLARGQQPSAAAYQLQNGLNQASAQQSAFAHGARGSASLATAGTDAAANTANLQQNAYAQGGILKSRDMATGRGMLGSMLGQQRDQDNSRIGMANDMGQYNANANDQYSLGMGQAAVGLGGVANGQDQQDFQYDQGGLQSVDAQSEADQQHQRWLADAQKQKVAANQQDSNS